MIFLQDFVFLYQKYSKHFLFDHCLFFLPENKIFVKDVLANLIDKNINQNTLICIALPYLGQQVVNLYIRLADILKTGF